MQKNDLTKLKFAYLLSILIFVTSNIKKEGRDYRALPLYEIENLVT